MNSKAKGLALLGSFSLLLFPGCGETTPKPRSSESNPARVPTGAGGQTNFRVRSDFAAGLNSDQGWAGALNEDATIHADQPFRVRFEVERAATATGSRQFQLQYRRNGDAWTDVAAHDFPHPESENAKTPRVSIVSCAAFVNGAATTDLLAGSSAGFQAGSHV